jgi:hypothetical protein
MELYREHIVFYVYRKQEGLYKLIGRLVYDTTHLSPVKKEYWPEVKINALSLGESFTERDEFLKRILAVKGGKDGEH